jgi:hypothetical protein
MVSEFVLFWSVEIFTLCCLVLDSCVLLFAVIRVRRIIVDKSDATLNVPFMTLHIAILVLLLLFAVVNTLSYDGGWITSHSFAVN